MKGRSLVELALGEQWKDLPLALKRHHQCGAHTETGYLNIRFPRYMQPLLWALSLMGALFAKGGTELPTRVRKHMNGTRLQWEREIRHPQAGKVCFDSYWVHEGGNRLTEYVNPYLGLVMEVTSGDGVLNFRGLNYVVRFFGLKLSLPMAILADVYIHERAVADGVIDMDFYMLHRWFGEIYRYSGRFETTLA